MPGWFGDAEHDATVGYTPPQLESKSLESQPAQKQFVHWLSLTDPSILLLAFAPALFHKQIGWHADVSTGGTATCLHVGAAVGTGVGASVGTGVGAATGGGGGGGRGGGAGLRRRLVTAIFVTTLRQNVDGQYTGR